MSRIDEDRQLARADRFHIQTPDGLREIDVYSEEGFRVLGALWARSGWHRRISYEVTWMGVPIIQLPEDVLMMQELICKIRPDVIIETGTAHGGAALFYASVLQLLGKGRVISIDVDIRKYNRLAIQAHPMSKRVVLIEGSSIDENVLAQVRNQVAPDETVLVALDSDHTYGHVRNELDQYSRLVTRGSYVVVFDGVLDSLSTAPGLKPGWKSKTPADAIRDFLAEHQEFAVDRYYNRLGVTYCPDGFLRREDV